MDRWYVVRNTKAMPCRFCGAISEYHTVNHPEHRIVAFHECIGVGLHNLGEPELAPELAVPLAAHNRDCRLWHPHPLEVS